MATERFFRLVTGPEQADADLARGTSLHQTNMTDPREPLYAHLPAERVDDMDAEEARERLADLGYIEVETGWALVLDGLCGFDEQAVYDMAGYDHGLSEFVAVFEGEVAGAIDAGVFGEGGTLFRPAALLAVLPRAEFDPDEWTDY